MMSIPYGRFKLLLILSLDDLKTPVVATHSPINNSSIFVLDDCCIHIVMDSHDSVQHNIYCLLDLVPWDDYLTNIAGFFWSPTL